MFKASTYIILATFLITLELYRIPTPLGFNIAFYHVFLGLALYMGGFVLFFKDLKRKIGKKLKSILTIFILFAGYSFFSFVRNMESMRPESVSTYLSELIGYVIVLFCPIFLSKKAELQKITKAFLASAVFVYLGAFWHIYNFIVLEQYVTGIPFWQEYSKSEDTLTYLHNVAWVGGLPRLRLPFSSPAGTGVFLSLAGILLLVYLLHQRGTWLLILLNLLNFFCLLGTFARASWAVFLIGSLVTLHYFKKLRLIHFGKVALTLLVLAGIFFIPVSLTPIGNEFFHVVGSRFDPEDTYTRIGVTGHLESRLLAYHYWKENPILGLGIGGFWLKPGGGIHTHSTYFTILVERGFIGLLLFLGFLFQLFRVVKRKIWLSWQHDKTMLPYNIGFFAGLIGLCGGMFLYEMKSEVVWLFLGIMLACVNLPSRNQTIFTRNHGDQRE
jgi:O-antigen ligase